MLNASSDVSGLAWTAGDLEVSLGTVEIPLWLYLAARVHHAPRAARAADSGRHGRARSARSACGAPILDTCCQGIAEVEKPGCWM